jgi:glutaredoxin 3
MNSKPRVVVFSTSSCSHCRAVKEHLRKNRIDFREIDIGRDEQAAREMTRVSGQQGVPVVLINGRSVIGFRREEIDRLLGLRSRPE